MDLLEDEELVLDSNSFVETKQCLTSLRVFRRFLKKLQNGEINAEEIISRECFELWVSTRKSMPLRPEKAFQRALSAHICGVDGRLPFQRKSSLCKIWRMS